MSWPTKNQFGQSSDFQSNSKNSLRASSATPFEGNKRQSITSDSTSPSRSSTNPPFPTTKSAKFKPAYAQDGVSIGKGNSFGHRGGRSGQGGFARIFQRKPGSPNLGAAMSGPSGALSGAWGI